MHRGDLMMKDHSVISVDDRLQGGEPGSRAGVSILRNLMLDDLRWR